MTIAKTQIPAFETLSLATTVDHGEDHDGNAPPSTPPAHYQHGSRHGIPVSQDATLGSARQKPTQKTNTQKTNTQKW
jgi:hypothetical protein